MLALACLCQALMPALHAQTMATAAAGNGIVAWLCGEGAGADALREQWRAQLPDAVAEALFAGDDAGTDSHAVSCPACISLCGQSLASGNAVAAYSPLAQQAPGYRMPLFAVVWPRPAWPPLPPRGPPARG